MLDCFLFNAPMLKQVSIVGLFKDPRQLKFYNCCQDSLSGELTGPDDNMSYISDLIKEKLTKKNYTIIGKFPQFQSLIIRNIILVINYFKIYEYF